jgi:hypothetical protein
MGNEIQFNCEDTKKDNIVINKSSDGLKDWLIDRLYSCNCLDLKTNVNRLPEPQKNVFLPELKFAKILLVNCHLAADIIVVDKILGQTSGYYCCVFTSPSVLSNTVHMTFVSWDPVAHVAINTGLCTSASPII